MLKHFWGGAAPSRQIVRDVVQRAYDTARESHCCDPRDLASGLGLRPCPTPTELAFIRDDVLHYPEDAPLVTRGLGIYRLLTQRISPPGAFFSVLSEMILPEPIAKVTPFCDLRLVQPHAPLGLVQSISMSHGRSGVIRAPRLR